MKAQWRTETKGSYSHTPVAWVGEIEKVREDHYVLNAKYQFKDGSSERYLTGVWSLSLAGAKAMFKREVGMFLEERVNWKLISE